MSILWIFTIYDVVKNLKTSAEEVALREGRTGQSKNRGYLRRVADHYCGAEKKATNITCQLAGIAVTLSWKVVEAMGDLLNKEVPNREMVTQLDQVDEDSGFPDARLCRNLFTKSTLRGATTFKTLATEADQLNTFQRLGFIAPQRNYKPVTKTELEMQTKKAIAASKEVEKMEKKLAGHQWPDDMIAVKETLLSKTMLDDEVEKNKENDELLPIFQGLWESLFPIAVELETANLHSNIQSQAAPRANFSIASLAEKERADGNDSITKDAYDDTFETCPDSDECDGDDQSSQVVQKSNYGNVALSQLDSEDCAEEKDEIQEKHICPLQRFSVRAENTEWQAFQRTLISEELYDFIIADPQQSLSAYELNQNLWTEFKDERKIKDFANFCCLSLRPGCYVFIFVLAEEFCAWSSALHGQGMQVMKAPFLVIPKAESARATRLKDLPQACGELAIVARTPGRSNGFKVNFNGCYETIDCTYSRKFGIIDNAPRCTNPLRRPSSRTLVRPRERHPGVISEIIETFCVPKGTVLDAFGGAFTSAISCISSSRPCVVLEKDHFCFELAMKRLEKICRDMLLSPQESIRAPANTSADEGDHSL